MGEGHPHNPTSARPCRCDLGMMQRKFEISKQRRKTISLFLYKAYNTAFATGRLKSYFFSIPIGFCNAKEIFVSPLGKDHINCTIMDNPCLTIQYAIDNVVTSNDVIKIDGCLGTFTVPREVRISNCITIRFTSYNGVAWIQRDRQKFIGYTRYSTFFIIVNPKKLANWEIHFDTINFRNTTVSQPEFSQIPQLVNITLTVKNCQFEFSRLRSTTSDSQTLLMIESQYSFITIENCTIKANCEIGIINIQQSIYDSRYYSTQITLRNTRIEDALSTVRANPPEFTYAAFFKAISKLSIINSTLLSRRKCRSTQFVFFRHTQEYLEHLLIIYMENSLFENFSALRYTAAVMDIQWQSNAVITNCTFKGNTGSRGGALSFKSGFLKIVNSHFYDNEARAQTICGLKEQGGTGGAILMDSVYYPATVKIYNSSFMNNKATCAGSSVYLAYTHDIEVKQSQFIARFTDSSDIEWFSSSQYLKIDKVSVVAREDSKLGGALFLTWAEKSFLSERMSVLSCPVGSILHFSDSHDGYSRSIKVSCKYCPADTYTLSPSNISVFNSTKAMQSGSQCQSCSFGAVCQRGIKPKANFWGYVHKHKAFMIVCPPGYCCQSSDQCISLKSCNSYRESRLCGKCRHGYFQSFFTKDCLEEKFCKVGKFWAVATITCLLFTVMFTFLQDMFFCLAKILNASETKRRITWLGKVLLWVRIDGYELNQRSGNKSFSDREEEEVEMNDELENNDGSNIPSNSSIAVGLIKIVFFFYQIHSILTVYKSNRERTFLRDVKSLLLSIFNLNAQMPFNREFSLPSS